MNKIKKGDEVIVLTGRSKGVVGNVLKFFPKENKALVESVNIIKKHVKPNPNKGIEGGIVEKESKIHISNLALYNPATKKADKVGFRVLEDGKKVRYFKSNNELVNL